MIVKGNFNGQRAHPQCNADASLEEAKADRSPKVSQRNIHSHQKGVSVAAGGGV